MGEWSQNRMIMGECSEQDDHVSEQDDQWSQRFHLSGGWSVEGIVSWENGFEMLICWESSSMFIS